MNWIDNRGILTRTSGFLAAGYTHTINPYLGCAFAGALCGTFCYAQHNRWITNGRPWALYGAKKNVRQAYRRDYDRVKRPPRTGSRPLSIYMSSSTDPYVPQELQLCRTRSVLEEMIARPPDVLVIQTHNVSISRDYRRNRHALCPRFSPSCLSAGQTSRNAEDVQESGFGNSSDDQPADASTRSESFRPRPR